VVAVPPWLVKLALDSEPVNDALVRLSPALAKFLDDGAVIFFLLASLYSWAILSIGRSVVRQAESGTPDTKGLLHLIGALDNVVGAKLKRLTERLKSQGTKLTAQNAFAEIQILVSRLRN